MKLKSKERIKTVRGNEWWQRVKLQMTNNFSNIGEEVLEEKSEKIGQYATCRKFVGWQKSMNS